MQQLKLRITLILLPNEAAGDEEEKRLEKERTGDDIMLKKCSFVSVLFRFDTFSYVKLQPATSRRAVLLWHCRETKRPEF